jgi:hypothetical protein
MKVTLSDPFGAAADPGLPTLAAALDPVEAKGEFKRRLPRLSGETGRLRLQAIRVTRHKRGRRCVVEYDVQVERPPSPAYALTLIGKVRARRFGHESFRLLESISNAGFQDHSPDGISVPEPIGVIPRFQMWFQSRVPGRTADQLLSGTKGGSIGRRIAEAIHKLHCACLPTDRHHTMEDELRILNDCLASVARQVPAWVERLQRLSAACERLGAGVPAPKPCGIHRDFYPAQVLVNDGRLFLIDFDLYCLGDPALDVGNFIGHMIEQSLRESGDPNALAGPQQAIEDRFVDLSGEACLPAIRAYTTLTLARHVYLSTVFPERQRFAGALLELCEQRLQIKSLHSVG